MELKFPQLIGKAPKFIKEEDLFDYFQYVFEFSWVSEAFEEKIPNLREYFEDAFQKYNFQENGLSIKKRWYYYILFALKEFADSQDAFYASKTIDYLIHQYEEIEEDLLELYVTDVSFALYNDLDEALVIRPFEILALESDFSQNSFVHYFLDQKDSIIQTIKKHLRREDIDHKQISKILPNPKEVTEKFSDFWTCYSEAFVNFFIFMVENEINEFPKKDYSKLVDQAVLLFLVSTVQNVEKIEPLANAIIPILNKSLKHYNAK